MERKFRLKGHLLAIGVDGRVCIADDPILNYFDKICPRGLEMRQPRRLFSM
jgi:hypothetical protein